jgi:hypothetical protein
MKKTEIYKWIYISYNFIVCFFWIYFLYAALSAQIEDQCTLTYTFTRMTPLMLYLLYKISILLKKSSIRILTLFFIDLLFFILYILFGIIIDLDQLTGFAN